MSQIKIEKLTLEQEALIPVYRLKWRSIALSTEPIDRQKAAEAIKAAYAADGSFFEPEILFEDSPNAALKTLKHQRRSQQLLRVEQLSGFKIVSQLEKQLGSQLRDSVSQQLRSQLPQQVYSQLRSQLDRVVSSQPGRYRRHVNQFGGCIQPEALASLGSLLDFCISVLNCVHDPKRWELFQSLVSECGWIFPFDKACVVCNRPSKLCLDSQEHLHAEGSPAIQFVDGYKLYAYHGVILPKKYRKLHPHRWQAKWLLKEDNAELRRVLIQGIGYARICQELQVTKLDSWREYTLLRIDQFIDLDKKPIYLLKMTCHSTGHIHALRVPPDMKLARKAIRWVNWGIEPEEFFIQT